MLSNIITEYKEIIMLGKVFKKDGINCVYGESGLGKTVSTIKALNEDGITPILLDFDGNDSQEANECKYIHIDGVKFVAKYMVKEVTIPKNVVIVIDTWALFEPYYEANKDLLDDLHKSNTLIIVAHNKDIATKKDIPAVPEVLINHWDAKLFLSFSNGTKDKAAKGNLPMVKGIPSGSNLTVMKLRSYKGPRVIPNWMRD
jgi:hypothetical protein